MTTSRRVGRPSTPAPSGRRSSSLTGRGMGAVMLATLFTAAAGYVVMLIAGRQLGAAGYAAFTVYWSLFFTIVGITDGLMQESTRAVSAQGMHEPAGGAGTAGAAVDAVDAAGERGPGGSTRPALHAAAVGLVLAIAVTATSPLWAPRVVPEHEVLGVAALAVSVWTVTIQTTLWGVAAGRGQWALFALARSLDAALRLGVAVWAIVAGYGMAAFIVATVAGAVSWILLLPSSSARTSLSWPVHAAGRAFRRRSLHAMTAAAATSVLIVGFPVLLSSTAGHELGAEAGSLLFAVTITRAPLLMPLSFSQSAIIVYFVERRDTLLRALALPLAAIVAAGAVGSVLAWWIGPPLIRLVGEGFDMGGGALAALVAGAVTTALLLLTGCAALSAERHRAYAAGWWVATGLAIIMLALPMDLVDRTVTAVVVGPLAGVAVHLWAALSAARDGRIRASDYVPATVDR